MPCKTQVFKSGQVGAASVRTSQSAPRCASRTCCSQPIEIAQQLLPFRRDARFAGEIVEMVLHRKRQEGTEHVTADGGVGGVKDRPRAHDRLGAAEEVLDPQQIAIAQHSVQ